METKRPMRLNENGELEGTARVEAKILGPDWSPLIRYRFYTEWQPKSHLTVWGVAHVSKLLGTYTPPAWFLKAIGQIKGEPSLWERLCSFRRKEQR